MELKDRIVKILEDKKGIDISVIAVQRSTLADYFVIVSATSNTHQKSLCDNLEFELKKENIYPRKIEGYKDSGWILMDYSDVIVHIFEKDKREFYDLEALWEKVDKE